MAYTTSVPVLRLAFSDGFRYYGDTTALTVSATVNLPVTNVTHRKTGETLADGQLVPAQAVTDFTVPDPWANGWAAPDSSHIVGWSYDVSMTITATGQPPLLWTTTLSPRRNPETITPGMGRVVGEPTGDAGTVTVTEDPAVPGTALIGE